MSIQIIPAIDIIDGKCVRLTKGDYEQKKVYNDNPLDVAKMFQDNGITRLHLVDLDGARSHHIVNYRVIEAIASHTNLTIDFGGGIKTDEDLKIAFNSGTQMITAGSIAVTDHDTVSKWLQTYTADRIILGADTRNGKVSINGWKNEGEQELMDFIKSYIPNNIKNIICTDIERDGMLQGPAIKLYEQIMSAYPEINVIASGGVSSMDDIRKLDEAGVKQVIVGKAIYEGRVTLC